MFFFSLSLSLPLSLSLSVCNPDFKAGECGTRILTTLNEAVDASGKQDLISLAYLSSGQDPDPQMYRMQSTELQSRSDLRREERMKLP